jgi:hypothetical protein
MALATAKGHLTSSRAARNVLRHSVTRRSFGDRKTMMSTCSAPRLVFATSLVFCLIACSSGSTPSQQTDGGASDGVTDGPGTGGFPGSGGSPSTGGVPGTGGMPGTGGITATGGVSGRGGASGTGGITVIGGVTGRGGASGTGGITVIGGVTGRGGATGTGGMTGTGGVTGRGGATGTGGSTGIGGATGRGGSVGTGGTVGSGGSTGAGGTTGSGGEYGFTYRSPGSHTVSCTGSAGTMTITSPDMDWLCTFTQADQKAVIYVRSTVTSASCMAMGAMPIYTTELAQISIAGVVTPLAQAQYSYGDVHNNDYLTFDYQGATYKYYHSSIGFGYRKCQPMDCINVYALDSTTLQTEGCSSARTLPEVCVLINAGGTHSPLVDTFAKCPGDPNE